MNRTRQSHSVVDPETVAALLQRKNSSLRKLATSLGFPASYNATLSDILNNKPGAITLDGENILRRAMNLPVIQIRPTRACPSCGEVHGENLDCGGRDVKAVLQPRAPAWVATAVAFLTDPARPRQEPNAARWAEDIERRAARVRERNKPEKRRQTRAAAETKTWEKEQ